MKRGFILLFATSLGCAAVIEDVRAAIARNDFASASELIRRDRAKKGAQPENLEALSWVARGAFDRKRYNQAETAASEAYRDSFQLLKQRASDPNQNLAIALGAAIEVQSQVLAAKGERSQAIAYLNDQLKLFSTTSVHARIQKNINLLSLEGKLAPPLENAELAKGKTTLLFFWAHWCSDCKNQAPIIARLRTEFGPKGLVVIAPTQKYGYVSKGQDAPPQVEMRYIEQVRKAYYAAAMDGPAPVSEENFRRYGASTTPTLVLVDRTGIVRLYHPGQMTYSELRARIQTALK